MRHPVQPIEKQKLQLHILDGALCFGNKKNIWFSFLFRDFVWLFMMTTGWIWKITFWSYWCQCKPPFGHGRPCLDPSLTYLPKVVKNKPPVWIDRNEGTLWVQNYVHTVSKFHLDQTKDLWVMNFFLFALNIYI